MSSKATINIETGFSQKGSPGWSNWPGTENFIEFRKEDIEQSLVDRFEQQVAKYPDRLALKTEDLSLSYKQLNRAANQLAHVIYTMRRGGEGPVAFLHGNRATQVISILAILKAGCMYLPLDPDFPVSRLSYYLKDSEAQVMVTDDRNLDLAQELTQGRMELINMDRLGPGQSIENLGLSIAPDCLANILYTSGSTGKAKGVPQSHRNLLHTIRSLTNLCRYSPDDRFALLASFNYSASINPLFGALFNGAALFPFNLNKGVAFLIEWLIQEKITIYSSVPTLFRHFSATLTGQEKFEHLRLVSFGGEMVLKSDVELYKKYFPPHCRLRVGLGGTEMLTVCWFFFDKETVLVDNVVPAGYVVEDKEVIILGENGQPLGCDEEGEIAVRSCILSPGYWRRPELTREKFLDDPEGGDQRIYRTGDLGRLRADGCLFITGRKDFQVKIRGFRVELGEIEAVLMQHPGIREAVVLAEERKGVEKRLVAYLVADGRDVAIATEELRLYLKKQLPDYMIPFAFVWLEEMPLTATGKVNRLGLPSLAQAYDLEKDFVDPRDELEAQLAQLWEELLEVSPVGIRTDFFRAGGHSLLAANLISQIEARFGKRIDLATLSGAPTIERLAKALRDNRMVSEGALVTIQAKGEVPPLYCVHGVGGHILPFRTLAEHLGLNQPVYGLQARGLDGRQAPETDLEAMAAAYVEEIRRAQPEGPYMLSGFSFGGVVAYEMARRLAVQGEKVALLAIFDTMIGGTPGFAKTLNRIGRIHYRARSLAEKYACHASNLTRLPFKQKLEYLRKRPERPGLQEVIMGDVDQNDLEIVPEYMQAVMLANGAALRGYLPKRYSGRVTLFKSIDHGRGVHYGWEELAAGGVEVYHVPGNHRGILQEPNIRILAEQLRGCIEKALAPAHTRAKDMEVKIHGTLEDN